MSKIRSCLTRWGMSKQSREPSLIRHKAEKRSPRPLSRFHLDRSAPRSFFEKIGQPPSQQEESPTRQAKTVQNTKYGKARFSLGNEQQMSNHHNHHQNILLFVRKHRNSPYRSESDCAVSGCACLDIWAVLIDKRKLRKPKTTAPVCCKTQTRKE